MTTNKEEYDEDGELIEYPIFTCEKVEKIDNGPGRWDYLELAIMQQDEKDGPKKNLGSFKRNYTTNFSNFAVCTKFGRYFALYSPDYTSTRVMEITPDVGWKDIGGEERNGGGFCPTGYHIPEVRDMIFEDDAHPADKELKDWNDKLANYPPGTRYISVGPMEKAQKIRYEDGKYVRAFVNPPRDKYDPGYQWVWGPRKAYDHGWLIYPPDFGFVSGCVWGDDSSWKIQYLDLREIEKGIIKREDKFGYIELPPNLTLKKAIDAESSIHVSGIGGRTVGISIQLQFDLDTGNCYVQDKGLYDRIVAGYAHSDGFMEREGWMKNWHSDDALLKERWEQRHAEFEHLLGNKPH